ncbi:hypothetical protein [Haloplanus aerogenes]|uniref:Uncharacterized protein n=1 Tax=Haloplanus aerogenes TaxID=660522 RepID=A0A3M0CSV0_9EURY|nr:hypothetical protein [Haloplanus aerogenes]AZH26930.1 hypothetical protein DU502_16800 [Haloplanus aerogenes]RMB12582.1 hypothetical protein ATH50_3250 [Haloplanus aerogenes]
MNPQTALVFLQSLLRSIGYLLGGRIRFPQQRLGYVLELPDGDRFVLYRETTLQPAVADARDDGVVLVFHLHGADRTTSETLRSVLFDPLANVATPFFAGMPGFRRKLWLAGTQEGEFLELYEWATTDDAKRFVDVLQSLLDPLDSLGAATFEIVEDDTVDEYVATRLLSWGDERGDSQPTRRRWRRPAVIGILLLIVGYLAWRGRSHAERGRRERR